MLNITRAFKQPRLMKAITGLSPGEFATLLPTFQACFVSSRKRADIRIGFGRPHTLDTTEQKLFFILFYVKCYPTYDLLSLTFDRDRRRAHEWVQELLSVLKKSLKREIVLPKRKLRSVEEFLELFPEVRDIWMDGTERPRRRPKDKQRQKDLYSGKKKRHTLKNIVMSDKEKRILLLTPTVAGRRHDYEICKRIKLPDKIPEEVRAWLDCAFQGIETDYPKLRISKPKRASRSHPLTDAERETNRKISQKRVKVEHAIGGMKRFRSLTDTLRNWHDKFADDLVLVGAGLWNFHLKMS